MTALLEIREKIREIYSKYEMILLPIAKFLLAFIVLNVLNGEMGYMTKIDNIALVLIVALMCSFLPTGCIILFGALFSLLHMYALSMEVALVGFCVYLVLYLLYLRFGPKDALIVILTPLLFAMKIPYVMPIAAGLLCSPASAVSVGCGVMVHYLLQTVTANSQSISTMTDSDMSAKLRLMIDGLIGNKGMIVVIAAFAITVIAVYLIRRMSIDHSWTIAMIAGAMLDVIILLIGDLIYDTNISVGGALLGSLVAVLVAKVLEFLYFCVDYSRTERVQFEDDEYYYYVKAVPKMTMPTSERTVKKINSQRTSSATQSRRVAEARKSVDSRYPEGRGEGRSVTTERTGARRSYAEADSARTTSRTGARTAARSVTIGSTSSGAESGDGSDDYEELF